MHGHVSAQEALVMAVSSRRLRGASSTLQSGSRTLYPRTQWSFPLPSLREPEVARPAATRGTPGQVQHLLLCVCAAYVSAHPPRVSLGLCGWEDGGFCAPRLA